MNKIMLADRQSCTGCSACVDACPNFCIQMVRDGIHAYPKINEEQCISCKKCLKICPSINVLDKVNIESQKYYACWHKNLDEVKTSTSGGVGTALAEHAIDNGYYVVGSVLKDGEVKHVIATDKNGVKLFKGSKYVQSNLKGIYKSCFNAIKQGHKIFFIGTPCQTEAMKRMLPTNMQHLLLTCSIICHGVNSQYVWDDYRCHIEKNYKSKLVNYNFRSKSHGWQRKNVHILRVSFEFSSGVKKDVPSWRNLFHYWYGHHYIMRPSCFNCQYRTEGRHSDFVIGDFWDIDKIQEGIDTFNGVSVLITTTTRGEEFFHSNPYTEKKSVDVKKSLLVLKGYIQKTRKEIIDKEIYKAKIFEEEYCLKGFDYMVKKYSYPTYFDMFVKKILLIISKFNRLKL